MKRWNYLLLLFFLLAPTMQAENNSMTKENPVLIHRSKYTIIREFNETLKRMAEEFDERVNRIGNVIEAHSYVTMNPFIYPMFMPFTYYSSVIKNKLDITWESTLLSPHCEATDTLFNKHVELLKEVKGAQYIMGNVMFSAYMNRPEFVEATEIEVLRNTYFEEEKDADVQKPDEEIIDVFSRRVFSRKDKNVGEFDYEAKRPNFWKIYGNASLQMTQNYISQNWYKGGESTNSMLSNMVYVANFNDEQKIQFDNKLELKLGFVTTPSDTMHSSRTNTDLIRITSKLGFRAVSKWYYTVQADLSTQFYSSFKKNTNIKVSAFLTPVDINLGLGMDFKKKTSLLDLSVFISPVSYHMRYMGDDDVNETAFGLDKGKRVLNELGCKIQVTSRWLLTKQISWVSRFYYFTNYRKVESEWENTFNFKINEYLSTKLFFHGRFYDAGAKKGGSYFQLKEILSFGLNYTW